MKFYFIVLSVFINVSDRIPRNCGHVSNPFQHKEKNMKWTERRECGGAKGRCDDSESFSESRNLSQVSLNFQPPKKDRNCLGGGMPRQGP